MTNDERSFVRGLSTDRLEVLVRALAERMGDEMPAPQNYEAGDRFDRRMTTSHRVPSDRDFYEFPAHLREWFDGLDKDDIGRLNKVIQLSPKTVNWIAEKNERELVSLDGAVEFITSSRTAAKVLIWVCGMAVAFVGGVVALAKSGVDAFSLIRGGR